MSQVHPPIDQLPSPSRERGIDAFRVLGAVGVIQLHFGPYRSESWAGTWLQTGSLAASFVARMAVPFFFVASGYLLANRRPNTKTGPRVGGQVRRILTLFAGWSAISLAFRGMLRALHHRSAGQVLEPTRQFAWSLHEHPLDSILQGPEEHLWFLPALAMGLLMYGAFERSAGLRRARPWAAAAVVILGLAVGPYRLLTLPMEMNPRNGPFLSFPLITIGAALAGRARPAAWRVMTGLITGFLLTGYEAWCLYSMDGSSPASHDALLGYVLTGPFLLLTARLWNARARERLASLGRLTLGIYAVHPLVAVLVIPALGAALPGLAPRHAEPIAFALITGVSALAAWMLSRFSPTRPLVQ